MARELPNPAPRQRRQGGQSDRYKTRELEYGAARCPIQEGMVSALLGPDLPHKEQGVMHEQYVSPLTCGTVMTVSFDVETVWKMGVSGIFDYSHEVVYDL